jgi:RimJ/RimL family protein N-acetyltransferase
MAPCRDGERVHAHGSHSALAARRDCAGGRISGARQPVGSPRVSGQPRPASDTIVTARLELRLLAEDDAPHFVRLFDDDWEAIKQTGRMPYPVTEAAMREWIALHAAGASMTFLMVRKEDGVPMGGIGFGGVGDVQELGYALGRAYWGQGYATEGVLAMIEHARSLGLRALEAFTFVENPSSARVLAKAGFLDLGLVRRSYPMRGGMRRVRRHLRRL